MFVNSGSEEFPNFPSHQEKFLSLMVGEKGERHVSLARLALTCGFKGTLQVQLHLINSGVEILQAAFKSILLLLAPAILSPVRWLSLSLQGGAALLKDVSLTLSQTLLEPAWPPPTCPSALAGGPWTWQAVPCL